MSRTWKIYTEYPVNPSCCTLQSSLPDPSSTIAKAGTQSIIPIYAGLLTACFQVETRETPDILSYLPLYGYLFCTLCRSAIPRKVLLNHLQRHHGISSGLSTTILRRYEHLPVAQEDSDIVPLPNDSRVLPFLAAPVQGFSCPHCTWLTINWGELRKHLSKTHSQRNTILNRRDVSCFLQQWVAHRKTGKYWRVDATLPYSGRATEGSKSTPELLGQGSDDPEIAALLRMEAEEEARLVGEIQGSTTLTDELEHDENTDWLRGSGWPQWFAHKPLHLIIATSRAPSSRNEDLNLGSWNCAEWISTADTEARLRGLIKLASQVLDRCEETLAQTPRAMCCWLRSWGSHFYACPFELPQRQATRSKYRSYLYRFLCYVFRSRQACREQRQDPYEIFGLRLNACHVQTMDFIWAELGKPLQFERGTSDPSGASVSILEALFQLLAMFWTDVSTDGPVEGKAVVHFSGVLGIHPYELAFRTAYDYTPYLSALIWVGRLVILEYALPLREYGTWKVPWPARATYSDQGRRLCAEIRPKYLQRGSFSPMGYLIERLQHGRAIAKREGARTNISWSLDSLLRYGGREHIVFRN
jgi:hypothetical protein